MTVNKKNEVGIVSIMVTMVMLIVISLIVLGFAEISRNDQRNSTDVQLSTEAYYAAESGVNDALAAIINNGQPVQSKLNCNNNAFYDFNGTTSVINITDNVSYTCLTINPAPTTLYYTANTASTVIPLTSTTAFNNLTLDWGVANGSSGTSTCNGSTVSFPPVSSWTNCNFPILRVDLLNANGQLARGGPNDWSNDTSTMYFVPNTSVGASQPASLSSRGSVFSAHCSQTDCLDTINLGPGGTSYYMRVTTIYKTDSKLTVTAGGTQFYGTQVIIDSTGKAQDILRRIEVAVDLTDSDTYEIPSGALITEDSVCKQFGVATNYFNISNPSMNNSGSGGDPLC